MKVETDLMSCIKMSLTTCDNVENFKSDIIVSMTMPLTDNFQYQSQFVNTDNISH